MDQLERPFQLDAHFDQGSKSHVDHVDDRIDLVDE